MVQKKYFLSVMFFVVFFTLLFNSITPVPSICQDKVQIDQKNSLAPYVPTPVEVVKKMLELARVKKGDIVYDLGCGDGRIVVTAAKEYGVKGVGIDFNPKRVEEALANVKENKVEDLVTILQQDVMTVDLSAATVVTMYLLPESNLKLKPNLEKYLKKGARVVSHDFSTEGWDPVQIEVVNDDKGYSHTLYLWVMGGQKKKK